MSKTIRSHIYLLLTACLCTAPVNAAAAAEPVGEEYWAEIPEGEVTETLPDDGGLAEIPEEVRNATSADDGYEDTWDDVVYLEGLGSSYTAWKEFRFQRVEAPCAFAAYDDVPIYSQKDPWSEPAGVMASGNVCYILEDNESLYDIPDDWLYAESGKVRGYVYRYDLITGKEAEEFRKALMDGISESEYSLDDLAGDAKLLLEPAGNPGFTHLLTTTYDLVVPGTPAFPVSGGINIREGKSTENRVVGTFDWGDLCYVLADEQEEWVYVESGDARGFVRRDLLKMDPGVTEEVKENGPDAYGSADTEIAPEENGALYYTMTSTREGRAGSSGSMEVIVGDGSGYMTSNYGSTGGGNGYHVNVDRTESSNVIIIGDSRIVAMSEDVGRVSYNATIGAHYLYASAWTDRSAPMIIPNGLDWRDTSSDSRQGYYGEMVSLVRNSMNIHGSCIVVIVATVNDADCTDWCGDEAWRMIKLGNALREDGATAGGQPSVYYMGLVPEEGKFGSSGSGFSAEELNAYLSGTLPASGDGAYIGIGPVSRWNGMYSGDGVHFTGGGSWYCYELILDKLMADSMSQAQ